MSQGAENTLVCGQERRQEECESDRVTATALSEDAWTKRDDMYWKERLDHGHSYILTNSPY